MIKNTVQKYFK